ncbi:unnamed protein product [Pedinophyceae sp. YPF-701]|nr:unnamed protein product [Pedinophyceae sp. YPF-701]
MAPTRRSPAAPGGRAGLPPRRAALPSPAQLGPLPRALPSLSHRGSRRPREGAPPTLLHVRTSSSLPTEAMHQAGGSTGKRARTDGGGAHNQGFGAGQAALMQRSTNPWDQERYWNAAIEQQMKKDAEDLLILRGVHKNVAHSVVHDDPSLSPRALHAKVNKCLEKTPIPEAQVPVGLTPSLKEDYKQAPESYPALKVPVNLKQWSFMRWLDADKHVERARRVRPNAAALMLPVYDEAVEFLKGEHEDGTCCLVPQDLFSRAIKVVDEVKKRPDAGPCWMKGFVADAGYAGEFPGTKAGMEELFDAHIASLDQWPAPGASNPGEGQ